MKPASPSKSGAAGGWSQRLRAIPVAQAVTIAAVVTIALFINALGVRHYRRWDLTADKRYSLSPATVTTLHELGAPVDIWILMSGGDPLRESVRQLLVAYGAETDKLTAHYIDPDRDPLAYLDVQKKFRMDAARTGNGQTSAAAGANSDAVIVVAQGEKYWFVTPSDLVTVESGDDPRAKPREERALTAALRSVQAGAKTTLCFVRGHGEIETDDGGEQGLGFLVDILEKDNYAARVVDASTPGVTVPYKDCGAVIVAGPRAPWPAEDANRLRTYLLEGGSALLAISPINADTDSGMTPPGLEPVMSPFGIGLDEDLVFETDSRLVFPESRGIRFGVAAKPHAITQGLLVEANPHGAPRIIVHFSRSLQPAPRDGAPSPSPLLITSAGAYGVRNIAGAKDWEGPPNKQLGDPAGPLTVAMASERAKVLSAAPHGPRLVVFGSGSAMIRTNWRADSTGRGMALAVENSIAWLTATPQVLDVPDKQASAAGLRVTEDDKSEVFRYVIIFMPLAWIALGAFVLFLRRSREGAPWTPPTKDRTP